MIQYAVVIPVYNAETTLKTLVEQAVDFFYKEKYSFEILLVDDGSIDKSWTEITHLKTQYPEIKGIRFSKNFGQHNATLCGILHTEADYIITLDDDLEYHPADIAILIDTMRTQNCDVVYGISKQDKRPLTRRWISKLYKLWSKMDAYSNQKGSSFRMIKKDLKNAFEQHQFKFLFLDEIILWYTASITYTLVPTHTSQKQSSTYTGSKLMHLATDLIMYSSDGLLKSMIWIGVLVAGVNGILILYYLAKKLLIGSELGFTSIIISILFSTGLIMLCLGVIGLYLGHIYQNSFKQPAYYIKEKL